MVVDPGCPFCRIACGLDTTAEVVCESETWVAFFPDNPATPGHTLVIPRAHVSDLWVVGSDLGAELMAAVRRVGKAISAALTPDGMNLITASGSAAGQTVFHLHLHVVPRWHTDPIGPIWPPKQGMNERLRDELAALVRKECAAN